MQMVSFGMTSEEQLAAKLLWQVKAIATREFESLPFHSKRNIFRTDVPFVTSEESEEESGSDRRFRSVSMDSRDEIPSSIVSPVLSSKPFNIVTPRTPDSPSSESMEHYDWSKRVTPTSIDALAAPTLSNPRILITQKYGKRKRENYVGVTTESGNVRATLRKKFSW